MYKYLLILLIFLIAGSGQSLGSESVCKNETVSSPSEFSLSAAETRKLSISLDEAIKASILHFWDLQISDYDILIAKTDITKARSEYFPKLNVMAGTEYTKNFRDIRESTVMSVGDAFINPYTRYQSVMGITLSYNLFDFGLRRAKLDLAKEGVTYKEILESEAYQELKLNLTDVYTKLSIAKKQIDILYEIFGIQNSNLDMLNRLQNAKEATINDVNDAKVELSKTKKEIKELEQIYNENLLWLEYYTGEKYDSKKLKIEDVKQSNKDPMQYPDYTGSLVWKLYASEIKMKESELKIAKRTNLPKVNAYGRYYLYGSDHSEYGKALNSIEPSNFTVGGNIYMPIFDGLSNHADIQKAKLELQQVFLKRDRAIAQWMTRLATLRSNLFYLNDEITENKKIMKDLNAKEKANKRLLSNRQITQIEYNNSKIDLLREKIEYEKNNLTYNSITQSIEALTTN